MLIIGVKEKTGCVNRESYLINGECQRVIWSMLVAAPNFIITKISFNVLTTNFC